MLKNKKGKVIITPHVGEFSRLSGLDKKTILYREDSNIDVLEFLREIAEQKTVICTWNGYTEDNKLVHVCEELGTTVSYNLEDIDCGFMELK